MRKSTRLLIPALVIATSLGAAAQLPVKYVLSDHVILADPTPAKQFEAGQDLTTLFKSKFEAAFPGQIKLLSHETAAGMIGPNERVILILPTLTAVRLGHEIKASTIHRFEASIVGDMSAIDPWTEANLMSGTRMVSAVLEIGESKLGTADEQIRAAFRDAYSKWLDAVIAQLKTKLSPFVLDTTTVAIPKAAKDFQGGIWPFGSLRGVKKGDTLSGEGRFASVTAVFAKFSIIQDAAAPTRRIPAGERYRLTLVSKPAERPEPTVLLSWVGPSPAPPAGLRASSLTTDAFLGLLSNYLSKKGGIQVLPVRIQDPKTREQVVTWIRDINSYSLRAKMNLASFDREVIAHHALETPDMKVEAGIMECYSGSRRKPDGSVEHYYRLTLGGTIRSRLGSEDSPCYPLTVVLKQREESAQVEAQGVRTIDESSVWFTVCRNGVIELAKRLRKAMAALPSGGKATEEGHVNASGNAVWQGSPPGSFVPLTWLRPCGVVSLPDGTSLGPLYTFIRPSQGYLNAAILGKERLQAGDVLRYVATDSSRPVSALAFDLVGAPPAWFPVKPWVERFAAKFLGVLGDVWLIPAEGEPAYQEPGVLIKVKVSKLFVTETQSGITFTGQWRCKALANSGGAGAQPLLKCGIQSDATVGLTDDVLRPLDLGRWGLQYSLDALKKLSKAGESKNLNRVMHANPS